MLSAMSRKKTKAQIIEGDNKKRNQQQERKKTRDELSDLCRGYLEKKERFKWFIERYYGLQKYLELWELAENDQECYLRNELEAIWFDLPDSIFNIQCAPPGWESFIALIDR